MYDLRVLSKTGSTRSKNEEGKDVKAEVSGAMDWLGYQPLGLKKETQTTNNNIYSNGKHEFREQSVSHSFQFPPKTLSKMRQLLEPSTLSLPPSLLPLLPLHPDSMEMGFLVLIE
jgi:hypothetical protein